VVLGDELVTRLWLPGGASELGPLDRRAVEHAAVVCALELLRQRTAMEVEWRLRGAVLRDLLAGNASAALGARAESLGHNLARPHSVLVVKAERTGSRAPRVARPSDVRRLLGIAQSTAVRPGVRALVTSWGDYVVVLWPEGQQIGALSAAEAIRQAAPRALGDATASAVVGQRCTEPRDYASAFRIARDAIELAQLRGGADQTLALPDLGVFGLLLQLEDPPRADPLRRPHARAAARVRRTQGPVPRRHAARLPGARPDHGPHRDRALGSPSRRRCCS
jgi:Sugar diacid utilization regulator